VFNGQHTIEIVALVSGSRETPVWCMVYDDLVYTQEADIFANQMKYVKSLLPYEIFMANIEAGNDRELIIRDLVESYDLTITSSSRPGGICAVSTLINIYEKYGFHTLDRVLRLCVATWEGAPMSFSSNMLNAIARLDNAYGETMKDDTFKEKVGRVSVITETNGTDLLIYKQSGPPVQRVILIQEFDGSRTLDKKSPHKGGHGKQTID